jgi:hypothetical protein
MFSSNRISFLLALAACGGESVAPERRTTDIVCGAKHACVLYSDGSTRCWGKFSADVPLPEMKGPFSQIGAGFSMCGLERAGTMSCWGYRGRQEAPTGTFKELSVSGARVCGLRDGGGAACRYLADPPFDDPPPPAPLQLVRAGGNGPCGLLASNRFPICWVDATLTPPEEPLQALAVGLTSACGLRDDGTIVCWGSDPRSPAGTFTNIEGSGMGTCARRADGSLTCWGAFGDNGQPITPPGSFRDFCVGEAFGCGIRPDESLACWGLDDKGQASPPQ